MPPNQSPSFFSALWQRWLSMRGPSRKRVLAGVDLNGNKYWEFPDNRGAGYGSHRRIVEYPRGTLPGDVQPSAMWHQWLRFQRHDAPTAEEQQIEQARQARIKILAAQADARWQAKPKVGEELEKKAVQDAYLRQQSLPLSQEHSRSTPPLNNEQEAGQSFGKPSPEQDSNHSKR